MSDHKPCVLLGVTGCIAAYKSCDVIRALQEEGIRVKVVMTEHATFFVGATTFRALTHEPVAVDLFDEAEDPIHHISLAQECDAFLIAPATANVIAKMAAGIADDLLTTTALSVSAPILVAPAMNTRMYEAAATCENLATLRRRGVTVIDPCVGRLACGDTGQGHLAKTDVIVEATLAALNGSEPAGDRPAEGSTRSAEGSTWPAEEPAQGAEEAQVTGDPAQEVGKSVRSGKDLEGLHVMVTAGPTVEPIDAVRFISNYSSGKMGYAIAEAAASRGAQVELISGPVSLEPPAGVDVVAVRTACDMLEAARASFKQADIAIFAAAVADVRPASPSDRKLKKDSDSVELTSIELVENPDVLATLAQGKRTGQCVVGFAAETDDVIVNAQEKLISKGADLIVANEVGDDLTFGADESRAWVIDAEGVHGGESMSKRDLADDILDFAKGYAG